MAIPLSCHLHRRRYAHHLIYARMQDWETASAASVNWNSKHNCKCFWVSFTLLFCALASLLLSSSGCYGAWSVYTDTLRTRAISWVCSSGTCVTDVNQFCQTSGIYSVTKWQNNRRRWWPHRWKFTENLFVPTKRLGIRRESGVAEWMRKDAWTGPPTFDHFCLDQNSVQISWLKTCMEGRIILHGFSSK